MAREDDQHSAAGERDALHAVNLNAAWSEVGPSHRDIEWRRHYFEALGPHSTAGVYVNFMHNDEGEERVGAA